MSATAKWIDCPKCKDYQTVFIMWAVEGDVVRSTINKCTSCKETVTLNDIIPNERNDENTGTS